MAQAPFQMVSGAINNLNKENTTSLLRQCEAEIVRLESALAAQKALKAVLETKLLHTGSRKKGISHMPGELLLQIFSEIMQGYPLDIGPILLVCRQWNQLACSSPVLWKNISFILPPDLYTIQWATNYVISAIRYSKNMPLDVEIHIPSLEDFWLLQAKELVGETNIDLPDGREELYDVAEWLGTSASWAELPFRPYGKLDEAIEGHMMSIMGFEGENVSRLRSLKLYCPSTAFLKWLDGIADRPTPLLEEFVLIVDDNEGPGSFRQFFTSPSSKLARIYWNVNWPVEPLLMRDGQLSHLHMALTSWTFHQFPSTRFTYNLIHLSLDCSLLPAGILFPRKEHFAFPLLEEFIISGRYPIDLISAPAVKIIRLLSFACSSPFLIDAHRFPSLQKLYLRIESDEVVKLGACINKLPMLTEVGFLDPSKDPLEEYMTPLREYRSIINIDGKDKILFKQYFFATPMERYWEYKPYDRRGILLNSYLIHDNSSPTSVEPTPS